MKAFLRQHWTTLALTGALLAALLAAQVSIFNTQPLTVADLESRAAALQAARVGQ